MMSESQIRALRARIEKEAAQSAADLNFEIYNFEIAKVHALDLVLEDFASQPARKCVPFNHDGLNKRLNPAVPQ